ncbi:MAG: hypothetical protein ACFCUO_08405 [Rhodospirillales bacterium]
MIPDPSEFPDKSELPPQAAAKLAELILPMVAPDAGADDGGGNGDRIPGTAFSSQGVTKLMAVLKQRAETPGAFWHVVAKRLYDYLSLPAQPGEAVVAGASIERLDRLVAFLSSARPSLETATEAAAAELVVEVPAELVGDKGRYSLTEIANFHGTDKGTTGPSEEWGGNNYADIYEAYFAHCRNAPLTFLEIGLGVTGESFKSLIDHGRNTGGGGSMKMWYDYFPNARIFGIDINPAGHLDNDRVRTFVADQGNVDQLAEFITVAGVDAFDFIVEDGTHRPDHQQISLGFFFRYVRPGGIYFIEDLRNNGLGDSWPWPQGRCDHILNTRRVLRAFQKTGAFDAPHGLIDADDLARHIDGISFHAPLPRPARRSKHPLMIGMQYPAGSERLCAIRRK